jgi:5-methylcytosine-specific restriction endonuclease McrA
MPYKDPKDRDYAHEYKNYDGTEKVKKRRALRNAARNKALKEGKVHKGDGLDLDHIKPLSKGGTNKAGNTRVVTAHANRSYKRNKDHSVK